MILSIKYFGLLVEITGCSEEKIEFSGKSISELKTILFQKYEMLKNKDFQIAQNNELTTNESIIIATEIALLPPFAGG
ncbi:MoaD/ThiS family protein [Flavobacteriaceae bacterium]|nr:MoaD/ThiS family protein [Flavobacteriaceae bacterium]MDB9913841.1 MoaD/ThiS family protein [Flavobacteriaceae bacterium]MDB9993203.1 MoaD/ThiS family protein [Flavobacteriaceae bacterium]MDC0538891.1 MoaD/ThiS family protein [Flavobacteriaceae bacterium]|tara:strand:+ start:204 stop:437 length:234 start_codon:yes stop_codon:yes gene_type:complete